jgi:excinuclease ABC subunit A
MERFINIEKASENNLKDISLQIPHYKLIVVTGVSGSGKSSLVHDVLSREGQRIFLDHFTGSNFHAQKKLSRPKVKKIEGLFPVLSVDQNSVVRNPRSTVGTMTEIYDYLRLLFARLAVSTDTSITPNRSLFSFNSPSGYCPVCKGLGVEDHIDSQLIIGDASKSLREGALVLSTPNSYIIYSQVTIDVLDQVCHAEGFSVDVPWKNLSEEQRKIIWFGSKKIKVLFGKHPLESRLKWTGITAKPREEDYYKGIITVMEEILKRERNPNIMRFVRSFTCPSCHGKRLNDTALSFSLWGKNIDQFTSMTILQLNDWFKNLKLNKTEIPVASPVVEAILQRLSVLLNLGLEYLSLNRESTTLSGGESQRIRLASQCATGLRNVLYLLDEPSAGMHPADHHKLLEVIRSLVDNGNTVIVVEHDEQTMHAADWIIDIGPGPGNAGGHILFNGPAKDFYQNKIPGSLTWKYLHSHKKLPEPILEKGTDSYFTIENADKNNLQHISVRIKNNALNVLTGVSGAGKSSLVSFLMDTVFENRLGGTDIYKKIIHVDQSPIGRTPNSNPATYTGLSDHVRDMMALLPESKARQYKKGQFSFVVKGGRCEACNGAGKQQIGMHFLGNVEVVCEECNGKRFTEETLEIFYKGKNIFDILDLSVEEAHSFFDGHKKIQPITSILLDLGLGYLKLGQASNTLSGGEAQRVKLATELAKNASGKILYILDEPTTGLHLADVSVLMNALQKLKGKGHTVLVIEHHPDFILQCDWVVDLGPGSGEKGGKLVFEGTPFQILQHHESITGKALQSTCNYDIRQIEFSNSDSKVDQKPLQLSGITTNNLKNIDISIPINSITAVTGVSGSGKSSLVFDTVFAECQRRFMDGMSSYVRQFIGKTGNPKTEICKGLLPAIGFQKKNSIQNPRSTVGTYTGIYDLYRLLYSRLGTNKHGNLKEKASAFSFNNEEGACPACKGLGTITNCDKNKLVSNPELSLISGALTGSRTGKFYGDPHGQYVNTLIAVGKSKNIDFSASYNQLSRLAQDIAMFGCGEEIFDVEWKYKRGDHEGTHHMKTAWPGFCIHVNIEYERKHADHRGESMLALMKKETCNECSGFRVKPEILEYRIKGMHIGELSSLSSDETKEFFLSEKEKNFKKEIEQIAADSIIEEILLRTESLIRAGLGYISISRPVQSLSGGEFQRLKLAALARSSVTGVAYMLDEPSFGLHPKDINRMSLLINDLNAQGNTIFMIDTSPALLEKSHQVIELGPSGGTKGGNIIYIGSAGPVVEKIKSSLIYNKKQLHTLGNGISVKSAFANNLKHISLQIPSSGFTVITGVSGSGKTSLLNNVIYESYLEGKNINCENISGFGMFEDVIFIGQDIPSASSVSTPLTWLGLSDALKHIFSNSLEAKKQQLGPSYFSFLSREGQCPECKGSGRHSISLDFWSDAEVICESCNGQRFNKKVLDIKIEDYSIADVLSISFEKASEFFRNHLTSSTANQTAKLFDLIEKTGLNYLTPGQPLNTLSTGELQRLKLVEGLTNTKKNNVLYLLDEPTGGLHPTDSLKLTTLFENLISQKATIICVTHDQVLSNRADHLIELGPGGGNAGGEIIFEGIPGDSDP